jgi:hypothetical protein
VALKSDGTAWTWGFNQYGQLGNGTTTNGLTPVQVSGLTGVRAIGSGANHTLAVKSDGTVWAWGFNYGGQLGNGTKTDSAVPLKVAGLADVQKVTGGAGSSVALKSDGTAWVWGANTFGQLGDGTKIDQTSPMKYRNLSGVFDVAANFNQILAVHHSEVTTVDCGDNADTKKKGCNEVTAEEFLTALVKSDLGGYPYVFMGTNQRETLSYYKGYKLPLRLYLRVGDDVKELELSSNYSFTSSDPTVITVDPSGKYATGVARGSAYITLEDKVTGIKFIIDAEMPP